MNYDAAKRASVLIFLLFPRLLISVVVPARSFGERVNLFLR